jgi:alanine transaminase
LARALDEAKNKGTDVRALCIINPGNPTGNCFSKETLQQIISFCKKNHLILLSDEVYQTNIYGDRPFISARKVAIEMEGEGDIEIVSFHSISKGLIGECGHRGGYYECHNMDSFVLDQLYKQSSICLCANIPGQVMVGLMCDPPRIGEASYERHQKETAEIWASLKRRADKMQMAFAGMIDVTCNAAAGAMYLFPRIRFPPKLLTHARFLSKEADEVYAMDLLNATGIVNLINQIDIDIL